MISHGKARNGFLFSALGIMAFMVALAIVVLILQWAGFSVGWGLQFQSPLFLIIMFMVLAVFAANLFGVFEISLPSRLQTDMSDHSAKEGYVGDFATGVFAAMLATPCSAPFLGTAVAFALTGRTVDVFLVFLMLGLGLAAPYFILALRPDWIRYLPKPGRWMVAVKTTMAVLLALTAIWLLWVLNGVAGPVVAGLVAVLAGGFVGIAAIPSMGATFRTGGLAMIAIAALIAPGLATDPQSDETASRHWVAFDRSEIPKLVSQGKTVFVDVTADWCLTCKANKALVLDRGPVVKLLNSENVVAMQADWTRPDEAIARFLESHNRFGIPFNIVYGPKKPNGILLSEVLSVSSVTDAISSASR